MYPFLIGWISYAFCDWIFTYATDHAILRYAKNKFVLLYNTKNSALQCKRSCLIRLFIVIIEKSPHERVLLVKGWKQFDVGSSKE